MGVPQAFLPVQQCLRGLSAADLQAAAVKGCVKACLHGVRHKVTSRLHTDGCLHDHV